MKKLLKEHNIKTKDDLLKHSKTLEQIYNEDGALIFIKGRIYSIEKLETTCEIGSITEHKVRLLDLTEHIKRTLE